ncbi:MAG TPA: hypothetical protein VIV40_27685 [Kofleriaceae bacterium]
MTTSPPPQATHAPQPQAMNRWLSLASWILPLVGMALAYTVLAWSSETDNTGKAWMAIGFGFVVVIWIVFRILVEQTALARSVATNDVPRILAITDRQLARKRGDAARGPFLVYRAYAQEARGSYADALTTLADAKPTDPGLQLLAAALRVLALVETGDISAARTVASTELEPRAAKLDVRLHAAPHIHANLARGRLLLAENKLDEGRKTLQRVIDDIRAGEPLRVRARELIGR